MKVTHDGKISWIAWEEKDRSFARRVFDNMKAEYVPDMPRTFEEFCSIPIPAEFVQTWATVRDPGVDDR